LLCDTVHELDLGIWLAKEFSIGLRLLEGSELYFDIPFRIEVGTIHVLDLSHVTSIVLGLSVSLSKVVEEVPECGTRGELFVDI